MSGLGPRRNGDACGVEPPRIALADRPGSGLGAARRSARMNTEVT
jgi:hypothetical protein